MHEQVRQQRRDRRTLWGSAIPGDQRAVPPLQRGGEPPLHVEQDPLLVGVMGDRLEHEVVRHAVEERPDVELDHPVASPASLPAYPDRIQRGLTRPVAVGVGVEHRFHARLQIHPHHRLGNPVGHGRHPEDSHPGTTAVLGDLHRFHRRREVAARREPIPDLEQVALGIPLEFLDRLLIDTRRTLVGLHPLKRFPDHQLVDLERLV